MKRISIILWLFVLLFSLQAIGGEVHADDGVTFDLNMTVDPSGGGTTDPAVGVHTYAENSVITVTATPATGYTFDHWFGDVADPDSASTTVTMDGDKTVMANFTLAIDQALLDAFDESLRYDLLYPYYPTAEDADGGFVENRSSTWELQQDSDKFVVTQARYTWTAAKASQFYADNPSQADIYLHSAAVGFAFLQNMWGYDYGEGRTGIALVVDPDGSNGRVGGQGDDLIYGHAFALYAAAAYYAASGEQDALDFAIQVYNFLDDNAYDPMYGGYYIALDDLRKSTDVNIHVLEALIEFYQALPTSHDLRSEVASRLSELLVRFHDDAIHYEIGTDCFTYPVMNQDWTSTSNGISFGHDVELAFLMVEAMVALGQDPLTSPYLAKIRNMVDFTFTHAGYRSDGALYYTGTYDNGNVTITNPYLEWWPQAEALNAACLMRKLFPDDPFYSDTINLTWSFIESDIIDHTNHGWVTLPGQWNIDKATKWHANYHNGRAMMNCLEWLSTVGTDSPFLYPIGSQIVNEGDTLEFTISAFDPNYDPLSYSADNLPPGANFNPDNQTFSWTPDVGDAGTYAGVHFEVTDGNLIDTEDITITVRAPLSLPLRVNAGGDVYTDTSGNTWEADQAYTPGSWGFHGDNYTVDRGTGHAISGTEDDRIYQTERYGLSGYRFDSGNGTYTVTLHFAETYRTGPDQRVFDISIEGQLILDNLDIFSEVGYSTALTKVFNGIVVQDGQLDIAFTGSIESPLINGIEIVSAGSNSPPVAVDDAYSVDEDDVLTVAAPGVLGNDSDANGDPLTATLVSDVSHGTLTLYSDGSFTYTPDAGYSGTDSFTYLANDGQADSNTATVTITITVTGQTTTFGLDSGSDTHSQDPDVIDSMKFIWTSSFSLLPKASICTNSPRNCWQRRSRRAA